MIESFRHKALQRLHETGSSRGLPSDMIGKISAVLAILDTAREVETLDLPAFRLHPLKGDRQGQWSLTIRNNWRIVFRFAGGNAYDVDFVDYH